MEQIDHIVTMPRHAKIIRTRAPLARVSGSWNRDLANRRSYSK